MIKVVVRFFIVVVWTGLILGALYLPNWSGFSFQKHAINVFTWGDILDPSVVATFERSSGIRVHLNYYSSNEELLVKLKATQGKGYDLIIPSDYAVDILREENLLKEIERDKLTFWDQLDPLLLGHAFDPMNQHSIPFSWEIFGFGIDKDYFSTHPFLPSWNAVFNQKTVDYRISMINDPIEAILFASFYLYGPLKELSQDQIKGVTALLKEQKKWVEAYASFRGDYFLATRNCPLVVASSAYIWRAMHLFDFVEFAVPEEGTFMSIENLCIPAASHKDPQVYAFINFLFEQESIAKQYETFGFFSSTTQSDARMRKLLRSLDRNKLYFVRRILPEQQMRDVWVEIKSSSSKN